MNEAGNMASGNDLDGLSGWLILVGVGIILSALGIILNSFPGYFNILSRGYLGTLLTRGSNIYNPAMATVIISEMVINVIMIALWGFVAYLFFTKKKTFPKWYIVILASTVVFILADSWAVATFIPNRHLFDYANTSAFVQTFLWACIWIPYTLMSKRVKATFVR